MTPLDFTLAAHDFDIYLLPEDSRDIRSERFQEAVATFYARQFAPLGGVAAVEFEAGNIHVTWMPDETSQRPFDYALSLLLAGKLKEGIAILDVLRAADPDNAHVLYNLGIAESESGHFDKAIRLLERAAALDPKNANVWMGLGIAHQRSGKAEEAVRALEKGVQIDPTNGLAQRNLGGVLGQLKRYEEAEPYFRAAVQIDPTDQTSLFNLARCLEMRGGQDRLVEAHQLYKQVIALDADSDIGELAMKASRESAQQTFRGNAVGPLRMDAVMYILGALQQFAGMDRKQVQDITFEIGMLGQKGLDVNNAEAKYTLKSLPGKYSGLHLLSIMYAGFKQIAPDKNMGFDLTNEYALAQEMFEGKTSRP